MANFKLAKYVVLTAVLSSNLCLMGCANIPNPVTMPNGDYNETVKYLPHAATTPVRDLNIGIKSIPRQLELLQNPYGTDTTTSCAAILKEARDLEKALKENHKRINGPDYDHDTRAGYIGEAAHDVVSAAAASVIPYRGIVRYASGAQQREKEGIEADRKGRQRLGFLVGTGAARNCPGFQKRRNIRR